MTVKDLIKLLENVNEDLLIKSPECEEPTSVIVFNGNDEEEWVWIQ